MPLFSSSSWCMYIIEQLQNLKWNLSLLYQCAKVLRICLFQTAYISVADGDVGFCYWSHSDVRQTFVFTTLSNLFTSRLYWKLRSGCGSVEAVESHLDDSCLLPIGSCMSHLWNEEGKSKRVCVAEIAALYSWIGLSPWVCSAQCWNQVKV